MSQKKTGFLIIMLLFIMAGLIQAGPLESLFLETTTTRMNGATSIKTTDAARYRMAPIKLDMLQNIDGSPALHIGDQFILNLFADVADTIIIDKIFNYLPGTYTVRGRVPGKEFTLLFLTFTGERLIGIYTTSENGQEYHIIYDSVNRLCCIKQMRPDAVSYMPDSPALLPPGTETGSLTNDILMKRGNDSTYYEQINKSELTTIDVMVVYTPAAKNWTENSENGINNCIAQALSRSQSALDNSNINITLNLVLAREVDYTESGNSSNDLYRLTFHAGYDPWQLEGSYHYMDEIHEWRDTYRADLVSILTLCEDTGGVGWLLSSTTGRPELGFCLSRVQQTTWSYTLIHEWGHNMGAHHRKDQAVQPGPGLYPYSAGWRWISDNNIRYCSVMSYQDAWNGTSVFQSGHFSSPLITFVGAPTGHATDGDNARSLNQIRNVIGAYRESITTDNPQISGFIRKPSGDECPNILVDFGDESLFTKTVGEGYYSIKVPYNWSGTATPISNNSVFYPVFINFKNVTDNLSNKNFTRYMRCSSTSCKFYVISPQGGEIWKHGEQHVILWAAIPTEENVHVDLYNKNGFVYRLKTNGTRNDGDFTWIISEDIPPDNTYKIRITGITSQEYDESDQVFTIKNLVLPDPPALLAPANGEINVSAMARLEWSVATNAMYWLQIAGDASFTNILLEDKTVLTSHYSVPAWVIPANTTCFWRVQTILDGANSDWSEIFHFQTAGSIDPAKLFISNMVPAGYQAVYLDEQEKYYTDRNYQVMSIPDSLKHLFWIRTANDDKNNATADMIKFQLQKGATIYIAYDSRATAPPDWLGNDFTLTNSVINVNDKFNYFTIWKKHAAPGPVTLGGNLAHGAAGAKTNYLVLLKADEIQPEIVISVPNGGETLYKGSTRVISWSCAGDVDDKVKIELYKAGSLVSVICDTTANNNYYTWTLPGSLVTGNDYKVRITSSVHVTVWDESNTPFTIADKPEITVLSPNGGETWLKGSLQRITWSSAGEVGDAVKIDLYKNDTWAGVIRETTVNDDSLAWKIPDTLAAESDYKVRIISVANNSVWDESDAHFAIADIPQLTLTSPNGGENWLKGSAQTITWNSRGNAGANLKIDLYKNGSFDRLISQSAANTGSLAWTVPTNLSAGKFYKVKITSIADKTLWDVSDSLFTITDHPKLTITSPNGGETWYKGSMQIISWNNIGAVDQNVKIDLYKNGALNSVIRATTANDDSLAWPVPLELTSGTDYTIRITSATVDTVWDESDSLFAILEKPQITVVSPNGEETWQKDSMQTITWSSIGNTGPQVKVELLKGGALHSVIQAVTNNDDSLTWSIPYNLPSGADYKIRITSLVNSNWFDSSNNNFTIQNPLPAAVNLLTPVNQAIITTQTPLFSWSEAEFATGFRMQVAMEGSFTSPVINIETDSCHYKPEENLDAGIYYWRALAKNESGESAWSAVFEFRIESSGILEYNSQVIPDHYFLAQNYPNPFNPVTTIKCGLPQAGLVEVRVINLSGQLISVLLSRHLPPGTATLTWNAAPYPSGVYYYVMTADGFREVKKMLLVK